MKTETLLNAPQNLDKFKARAEQYLYSQYPQQFDSGNIHGISIGRNKDGGVGDKGGYRLRGTQAIQQSAMFVQTPKRMIMEKILADPASKTKTIITRASDAVKMYAIESVAELVEGGTPRKDAEKRVADSMAQIGYYDKKLGTFVIERLKGRIKDRTNDSILSGLATPYWDIAQIQKVFKQPFLRGYSDVLVNEVGVPNMWADLIQIFTETFEGSARISNVARGSVEFNTSIAAKNRTHTMLSDIINLVIDYESQSPNENIVGGMPGNWLTNAVMGDRDAYANLMVDQLACLLWYFGNPESGFDGLTQIANRDGTYVFYDALLPPAEYMWDNDGAGSGTGPVNATVGADLLLVLNHMLGDMMEDLFFLPVNIKITCAPVLYKTLKFSMLSKVYNQNNPLSIIATAFEAGNKIQGTLVSKSGDGLYRTFELVPDPMLGPNTPFNATDEDLTFITFPTLQSELDENSLTDLIMAPVPIKNMILPSAPGYRDGVVRTSLKRIGSLLCPVAKTVHVISGMGTNSRYTPPST